MRADARKPGRPAALAALLLALVLVTGCGGGEKAGGLGTRPVDEIVRAAQDAARSSTAVHVTGSWVSQGQEYRLDLRLKQDGAIGTIDTGGQLIELLRVGAVLFVRGDENLYRVRNGTQDDETSAQVLRDKFVKVPEGDPSYARLSVFTHPQELIGELFRLNGKVKKNGRKTVRGVPTLELVANKGHGGELFVAAEGVPFPMRYSPSPAGGRLDLFEYNQDFPVAMPPPEQILDYGRLSDTPQQPGGDGGRPEPGPSASARPGATPAATPASGSGR